VADASGLDDSGQVPWLESRGVTLIRGHGRLEGERRVRVGDQVLHPLRPVVIATGSGAAMPPIPGLAKSRPRTNQDTEANGYGRPLPPFPRCGDQGGETGTTAARCVGPAASHLR
jgi:pyruvate/2-oxoglutarate dehydrogenase complex dihydrolipoamide dehydrogenase (E3) component